MKPESRERRYHSPEQVGLSWAEIKREKRLASLPPTVTKTLIIGGAVLAFGAGIIYTIGPVVGDAIDGAIKQYKTKDDEVYGKIREMHHPYYYIEAHQSSKENSSNGGREYDPQVSAIDNYLRAEIGDDFQVFKANEPLIAQSVARSKDNKPIGHHFYSIPNLDPKYRIPGDSIDFGAEIPVYYWVSTFSKNGPNSFWLVSFRSNPNTNWQEYRFANDLDGNNPLDRWSFSYRKVSDKTRKNYDGSQVFGPEQIWDRKRS